MTPRLRPWATPARLREIELAVVLRLPTGRRLTARQRRRALRREAGGRAELFDGREVENVSPHA